VGWEPLPPELSPLAAPVAVIVGAAPEAVPALAAEAPPLAPSTGADGALLPLDEHATPSVNATKVNPAES
jgi:hypothetical protein